jgi:diacylglycerol kinase family enzyme
MTMITRKSLYVLFSISILAVATNGFSATILSTPKNNIPNPEFNPISWTTPPPLQVIQKPNVAIILNTNARSVTAALIPLAESVLGKDAVYCTTTAEQAQQAALSLIKQNISLVVAVGGDGTLSSMIHYLTQSIILQQHQKQPQNSTLTFTVDQAVAKLPTMAYIPMGTGNGVGSVVACQAPNDIHSVKPSLFAKIFRRKALKQAKFVQLLKLLPTVGNDLASGTTNTFDMVDLVELPMLEIATSEQDKGHLCFFAGVGFDSLLLQDFKDLKEWSVQKGILRETLGSVTGYVVALVSKTLPKCIQRNAHQIQVEITSTDPHAVWIDHRRGDVVRKIAAGDGTPATPTPTPTPTPNLVYKGTAGIVAAGTSPFYGGGLRLFPFARMTLDKMHLRVGRIHPFRGFLQIPRIFRGSYRDTRPGSFGCLDFLASDFTVSVRPTKNTDDVNGTNAEEDTAATTITTTPKKNGKKNGYPLQHSGESIGSYEQFRLRVVPSPVKFVTFFKKRIVDDTLPSLSSSLGDGQKVLPQA